MRSISSENSAALAARALVARDFLWIVARNRSTGASESVGFWSGLDNVTANVIDPSTGSPTARTYYAGGGLVEIDAIPAVSVLQVQDITIRLSQLDEQVNDAIRLYDIKQARVEIHRGLFDPASGLLVDSAIVRFVGFVNFVRVITPAEGQSGGVELTCVSHTQEMVRSNPSTRSHEDQITTRDANDTFFVDAAVVGTWEFPWGAQRVKEEQRKGLFGWNNFLGFL